MTMFRRNLKNNLKNEIMRNEKFINDMFDLIEIVIDLDNKLYKRAIKKRYNQFHEKTKIFFELTIEYYSRESCFNQKYNNLDYREPTFMKLDFIQKRKEKNSKEKQDNKS
jgi:hypothetical protein